MPNLRPLLLCLTLLVACNGDDEDTANPSGLSASFHGATAHPVDAPFRLSGVSGVDGVVVETDPAVALSLSYDAELGLLTAWPEVPLLADTDYLVTVSAPEDNGVFALHTGPGWRGPAGSDALCEDGECARVFVESRESDTRAYRLTTDHPLRDSEPASSEVQFHEEAGQPILRSGHDLFDALFAMAIHETRQLSVDSISDYAFNGGAPIACDCFQTGERWHYVWTRDTAYAVDLGLAWLDPARSRNALDFKLSRDRDGGPLHVVQDTGTGGSWPVSTDRVVWAVGAARVLDFLEEPARSVFAERAREALQTTAELDRSAVYDPQSGLYRGEQSFLDWREQSYPSWVEGDVVTIGMSATLSTNMAHLAALELLTELSDEAGLSDDAARYGGWADALRTSLDAGLYSDGTWSTMRTSGLDPAPVARQDLLGTSLASTYAGQPEQSRDALAAYPRAAHGPPVQWPQLPDVPIYHNRAIWPFVTAYGLRESARHDLPAHVHHDLVGMVRSSALNVSNMENLEFLTGDNWVGDGDLSGPVVNSRRQLWSVAGYLSAVVDTLFGLESTADGLRFVPFVPGAVRDELFAPADRVRLEAFPYRGRSLTVELRLPPAGGSGEAALVIDQITLNGEVLGDAWLSADDLSDGDNLLAITLVTGAGAVEPVVRVGTETDGQALFSPSEPRDVQLAVESGGRALSWSGSEGAEYAVYRDGERIADALTTPNYTDSDDVSAAVPCYAIEARWPSSGLRSHHSPPACAWGPDTDQRVRVFGAAEMTNTGGALVNSNGREHWAYWGGAQDRLELSFTALHSGPHLLSLTYANGAGGFDTGVTAGVKQVVVSGGGEQQNDWIMLPHTGAWDAWRESSFARVELQAGTTYTVQIVDGFNMSYLQHFALYGGTGGAESFNDIDIAELKLLSR